MNNVRWCKACGKDGMTVADVRELKKGLSRKRKCVYCGVIIRTIEISEEEYERLQQAETFSKKVVEFVKAKEGEDERFDKQSQGESQNE